MPVYLLCVIGCLPELPAPLTETGAPDTGLRDRDGDGVADALDCAPDDASISPDQPEICGDEIDDDCDGIAPRCLPTGTQDIVSVANGVALGDLAIGPGGDFDGDGVQDLAYSVSMYGGQGGWVTQRYDPLLGPQAMGSGGFTAPAPFQGASGVPDLDGDGRDELVVIHGSTIQVQGLVTLLFGPDGSTDPEVRTWRTAAVGGLPASVTVVDDTSGDGQPDLWIGSFNTLSAASLLTSPFTPGAELSLSDQADASVSLPPEGAGFGGQVGGGDLDGDGLAELILGSAGDSGGPDPMTAFVYPSGLSGTHSGQLVSQPILTRVQGRGELASVWDYVTRDAISTVSSVDDVDGDGCGDLATGMATDEGHRGTAMLVLGCPASEFPDPIPFDHASIEARILGPTGPFTAFGSNLATVPGLDGDDGADLVVAAPEAAGERGRIFVFAGAQLSGTIDLQLDPGAALLQLEGDTGDVGLGLDLASVGDIDGDGLGDLGVGTVGSYPDRTYLLLGGLPAP